MKNLNHYRIGLVISGLLIPLVVLTTPSGEFPRFLEVLVSFLAGTICTLGVLLPASIPNSGEGKDEQGKNDQK